MSKINAVRIINLNYNNNAIKISDEIFNMNGETTLLSLQNGGGKSVLVQMIMAPFVHKRYQNAKDRPFASYFTTDKPTFIMVEWKLDGGNGYVLTGMMVRKSQEIAEDNANELEMINFIVEYSQRCNLDIYHIPVVEKTKKEMILKSFQTCKKLFETHKREHATPFFYYDMNQSAQSKQYFDKLMEYQIHYKEWETIIKKINLKESGLSDLFSDCKDEKGLVEKWFLDAVENKLNKERNRMHEFQSIVEKYIVQYKDNQSKMKRRDAIKLFQTEAQVLKEEAETYGGLVGAKKEQESRIADFINHLTLFMETKNQEKSDLEKDIETLLEEIAHLEYERISSEIHEIQENIHFHSSNYELIQMEKDTLQRELELITRNLHLFLCAKLQTQVNENADEYEIEKQKLALCQEKEQDLEPERNSLGSQLNGYYGELITQNHAKEEACQKEMEGVKKELESEKELFQNLSQEDKKLAGRLGEIRSDIRKFDGEEDHFNQRYQAKLCRNILGQYEAGMLSENGHEYEKELEESRKERTVIYKSLDENKGAVRALIRNIQDMESDKVRKSSELAAQEGKLAEFEQELKERATIMRYFQIDEEKRFHTEDILAQTAKKLRDTEVARRALESEEEELSKEYRKLTQGQVLELSEEFKNLLENVGITPVYGMEWLLKNQKGALENQKLVEANPFLPYALIMTRQELEKLSQQQEHIYTSCPVPILVREKLEAGKAENTGAIKQLLDISFYVWFNKNLLDEVKLQDMVAAKEREIKQVQENIARKKLEYSDYFEKQEKIRNQRVTRETYDAVKANIEAMAAKIEQAGIQLSLARQEQETCETLIKQLEQQLQDLQSKIQRQEQRSEDYLILCGAYEIYQQNQKLLEQTRKEQNRIEELQKLSKEKTERLESELQTKKYQYDSLQDQIKEYKRSQMKYAQYELIREETPLSEEEAKRAENRYAAITANISSEKQEKERLVEQAAKRYNNSVTELKAAANKYGLTKEQWSCVIYDSKEELHQENLQLNCQKKITRKDALLQSETIKIEKLKTKEEIKHKELKKQCNTQIPLGKEEIHVVHFDDEIQKKNYAKKEVEVTLEAVQKKIRVYEELTAALAEYDELECRHDIVWNCSLEELNAKELTAQKGILIRDYNDYQQKIQNKRGDLDRLLGKMSRLEEFNEPFYQKPIEALMGLTSDAMLLLKQLDTILQSFENLMEKLLVDISFVEKEKDKVVELMEDYLKEVHSNLAKIDHNSTITIRDKAVKMLKINLPEWTENESVFHLRMQDYVDEVTSRGIGIMNENENITEFLGTRITTNELYEAVVGIANVQIRMYKIEAQREYPITWSDVAKNSGGEGFLSAFVILSSLLYYMRRDDSDLFADRNEGKVLIMDNPFAQTNASHLLKPLMDMAKKANTQLICLSGLGGESIYNRFDNIYVLNLIAANLRNGMQYLKADHIRGSEEETMLVSQIEVMEQMQLEF